MEFQKKKWGTKPQRSSLPLLIGRKPIEEALEQGKAIEKIFLLRSATGVEVQHIKQLAKQNQIPLSLVPVEKLNHLTKAPHQGIIALSALIEYMPLQECIDFIVGKGQNPLFVLLDGVTDVRNVGAIARTALCCGAQVLVLPNSHAASLTEEAIKSSAGALHQILLCRVPSVAQAIDIFKLNGIQVLATHLKGSNELFKVDFTGPSVIVMGAEDKGISKECIRAADQLIHIPMQGKFDSLNVSVASGMILYEAMKQRMLH